MNKLYYEFVGTQAYSGLTDSQKDFFKHLFEGKNILLTGAAGTGKSFCLRTLFEFTKNTKFQIAKTASTGIAAVTIGGSTIHSFAGVGLADKDLSGIIQDVKRNKKARTRITTTRRLFLDETSMIDSALLDKLDMVFKYFRNNNRPFGGMQMIFAADFLQLPPVFKNRLHEKASFAFDARSWREADIQICYLNEIKRQDKNGRFAKVLSEIRMGDTSNLNIIQEREGDFFKNDPIQPIKLFATNSKADEYNHSRLNQLECREFNFTAIEFGEARHLENLERNCLAPRRLTVKVGAQVILLANLDTENGWVNGTLCRVVGIENNLPVIQREDGQKCIAEMSEWTIKELVALPNGDITYNVIASRKQIPLKLGYAITIHKSQSLTLDKLEIDFSGIFECAQVYVALSRARTLEGLSIKNLDKKHVRAHPRCVEFYSNLDLK